MRSALAAFAACVCISSAASSPAPVAPVEATGLRSIAGWLKTQGAEGFLAADVADAIGIPRNAADELIAARQRGFRDAEALHIAQFVQGDYMLFMVQTPDEVYFYLCTVGAGLRKALVSIPARGSVTPLGAAEAQANFEREILYWEDKAAR